MFVCPSVSADNRTDTTYAKGAAAGDYGSVNGVKTNFWIHYPQLGTYPGEDTERVIGVLDKNYGTDAKPLHACRVKDITDGTSKTIMVAEDAGRPDYYENGIPTKIRPLAHRMSPTAPDGLIPIMASVFLIKQGR